MAGAAHSGRCSIQTGVVIGRATANAVGTFTASVTIPLTAPLGTGSFVTAGLAVGGAAQLESRLIQLTG